MQIFSLGLALCFFTISIVYIIFCQSDKFFEENTNGISEIWSSIFLGANCIIYVIECQLVKYSKKYYRSKYLKSLQVFLLLSGICFLCCSISLMVLLFSGASTICFLGSIFSFIFVWLVRAAIRRKKENQFYVMNEKNELVFLLEENDEENYVEEVRRPINNNNSLWKIPEVASVVDNRPFPSTLNNNIFKYNKMKNANSSISSENSNRKKSGISKCLGTLTRTFLWLSLVALYFTMIMFTSTIIYSAYCMKKYPPPGIQIGVSLYNETEISYLVSMSSRSSGTALDSVYLEENPSNSNDDINNKNEDADQFANLKHPTSDMHIYCTGTRRIGSPLIIYEAGEGLSGFEYYGQQKILAQTPLKRSKFNDTSSPIEGIGIRSCSYDRGGYGWSDNVPIANNDVYNSAAKLYELLRKSGELDNNQLLILVGHGKGGLFAQTYAYFYPDQVIGLVLIDTYPEYDTLHNFTPFRKFESSNKKKACMNLNLLRAGNPLGISPLLITSSQYYVDFDSQKRIHTFDNYNPPSEQSRFVSTFWNLKNFPAIWNVYCRWQGYSHTEFLTRAATLDRTNNSGNIDGDAVPSNPHYSATELSWPPLKNPLTRVLILSSPRPTTNYSPESDLSREDSTFFQQAQAYNNTLSPIGNSQWKICEKKDCDFTMPWKEPDWIVDQIVARFEDLFV